MKDEGFEVSPAAKLSFDRLTPGERRALAHLAATFDPSVSDARRTARGFVSRLGDTKRVLWKPAGPGRVRVLSIVDHS